MALPSSVLLYQPTPHTLSLTNEAHFRLYSPKENFCALGCIRPQHTPGQNDLLETSNFENVIVSPTPHIKYKYNQYETVR